MQALELTMFDLDLLGFASTFIDSGLHLGIALGGLLVGFIVGLTGMGGGALMTPMLVLGFGVPPLTAVSTDLVASAVMKPVGGGVHVNKGTVHRGLAFWLIVGSVPSSFAGVVLLRSLGDAGALDRIVRLALGVALLVVAAALVLKNLVGRRRASLDEPADDSSLQRIEVRRWATLIVGVLGGLVVGTTSVGSGSLMMLALLLLYPKVRLGQLVGTDLVQAVPLVAAAALAHVWVGQVEWALAGSILLGAVPGVYFGARLSVRAPDRWLRPVLIAALCASGMKLLGIPTSGLIVVAAGLVASLAWAWLVPRVARAPS